MGKTSLVRSFVQKNKENFDSIVYLNFKHSLERTIFDLEVLNFNEEHSISVRTQQFENRMDTSFVDTSLKKIAALSTSELVRDCLLIVDNVVFDSDVDEEQYKRDRDLYDELLKINMRVIFIGREPHLPFGYTQRNLHVPVGELGKGLPQRLFTYHSQENLEQLRSVIDDYSYIDKILNQLDNTLAITIFAKKFAMIHRQNRNLIEHTEIENSEIKCVELKLMYERLKKQKPDGTAYPFLHSMGINKKDMSILADLSLVSDSRMTVGYYTSLMLGLVKFSSVKSEKLGVGDWATMLKAAGSGADGIAEQIFRLYSHGILGFDNLDFTKTHIVIILDGFFHKRA